MKGIIHAYPSIIIILQGDADLTSIAAVVARSEMTIHGGLDATDLRTLS